MRISIYENFRAVFYTPFYLCHSLGVYEAEGLDVALTKSAGLDYSSSYLDGATAAVYWGGPMRLMLDHDRDPSSPLVGFCEVVARDPFFLVGAEPRPGFAFEDLASARLGSVSEVPTPWLCLQDDLRRQGMDPASLTRLAEGSMADNVASLRDGRLDVAQVFQPYVEDLLRDGSGHIWYAAADRGACSYTVFYARRTLLAEDRELLIGLLRAVHRMQEWLHSNAAVDIAAAVSEFFPDLSRDIIAACAARYLDLGIWSRTPVPARDGYQRLHDGMLSGGLIGRPVAYDRCIDPSIAEAAVAG